MPRAAAMAPMFQTTAEGLLQSPMALIGTPDECVAELKRRARDWEIDQFVFSNVPADAARQIAEKIVARMRG